MTIKMKKDQRNRTNLIIVRDSNVIRRNKKYVLWLQVGMNKREIMHDCKEMPNHQNNKKNQTKYNWCSDMQDNTAQHVKMNLQTDNTREQFIAAKNRT